MDTANPRPARSPLDETLVRMARPGFHGFREEPLPPDDAWHGLLHAASAHGLLPALASGAADPALAARLPEGVRDPLVRARSEAIAADRVQAYMLGDLLDGFARRGIPALLLKGQSLAERLFPDPALRVSRDVDLLVPREALDEAGDVLAAQDFEPHAQSFYRARHFHERWLHRGRVVGGCVELHWDVTLPRAAVRFDVARWFEQARAIDLRAGRVAIPPAADELAYVAWHALAGGRARLRDLGDVAGLLRDAGDAGLPAAAEQARAAGASRFLATAFELAESFWPSGVRLPETGPDPRLRGTLRRVAWNPSDVIAHGSDVWWAARQVARWSLEPPERSGIVRLLREAPLEGETPNAPSTLGSRLRRRAAVVAALAFLASRRAS